MTMLALEGIGGRFLVETHLRTGGPIAELAAAHWVHRSWLYKLPTRYRREGAVVLEPSSMRPHASPAQLKDRYEEEFVTLRKQLVACRDVKILDLDGSPLRHLTLDSTRDS